MKKEPKKIPIANKYSFGIFIPGTFFINRMSVKNTAIPIKKSAIPAFIDTINENPHKHQKIHLSNLSTKFIYLLNPHTSFIFFTHFF